MLKTVLLCVLFSVAVTAQISSVALTNARIGDMVVSGVSAAEVIRIINSAPTFNFDLRPGSTDNLLKAGVSEEIIKAMAARESGAPVVAAEPAKAPRKAVVSGPVAPVAPVVPIAPKPVEGAHLAIAAAKSITSLSQVRRVYIEKLPNNFDEYLRAELYKQMPQRIMVVTDKDDADGVIVGTDDNDRRIAAIITGRYLGLHDNATASISVLDPTEKLVLWSNEAGDRSLVFPIYHRTGVRKVASRIVGKLKRAMKT